LFVKKITISGKITITESNVPVNAKLILLNQKLETISIMDSTHFGKYNINIDKSYYNKSLFIVISNIKSIVEKSEIIPNGFIHCNNETDTLPIEINNYLVRNNIRIKICEPLEIQEFNPDE
tara:strand:- start:101 stop:463 length:363 start_codon:yes stop_codon:yes gene_type:complete